jgi:4-amino-4-deoxy-L-arabinose transferase-like glycosyltransferase
LAVLRPGQLSRGSRLTEKRTVLLLLLPALAVQLAFVLAVGDAPLNADEVEYVTAAQRLAGGLGLTAPDGQLYVHRHPPGYVAFVAAIFYAGGGVLAVRLVQAVVAVLTLAPAYATARAEFGSRTATAALLAGALYLPAAYYSTKILTEAPFTFALVLGVYLLARGTRGAPRYRWLACAGITFGAAALVRSVAFPAALALAAYVALGRDGSRRARLAGAATFACGLLVALAPWSGYVFSRTGHVVATDTNGSAVLYIGNNPRAPYGHTWKALEDPACCAPLLEVAAGGDGFHVAAEYRRAALRYIAMHPAQTALRCAGRLLDMLGPERLFAATYAVGEIPALPAGVGWPMAALEVAADAAALALCGLGLVLMPASRLRGILAVLFGVAFVVHGGTLAYPRYHVPLVLAALAAVGYALTTALPALRERRLSRRQWVALAVVAAALLASWTRMVVLYAAYRR